MAYKTVDFTQLTDANRLYFYALLKSKIGIGRQTFLPKIEDILIADNLPAERLGFSNTRALMEALGNMLELKVFKGGRVYVTLVAQPDWDTALETPAPTPSTQGKPWKRKRQAKQLKPQKPRLLPRIEAKPEHTVEGSAATDNTVESIQHCTEEPTEPTANPKPSQANTPKTKVQTGTGYVAKPEGPQELPAADTSSLGSVHAKDYATGSSSAALNYPKNAPVQDLSALEQDSESTRNLPDNSQTQNLEEDSLPRIALTITYDPDHPEEKQVERELVSTLNHRAPAFVAPQATISSLREFTHSVAQPVAEANNSTVLTKQPHTSDACQIEAPSSAAQQQGSSITYESGNRAPIPSAQALSSYPRDFETEVYFSDEALSWLSSVLPIGAPIAQLLTQDFRIARSLDTLRGTRAWCAFPLRFLRAPKKPLTVYLKYTPSSTYSWLIDVERCTHQQIDFNVAVEGLPQYLPEAHPVRTIAEQVVFTHEALVELIQYAMPAVWTPSQLALHLAAGLYNKTLRRGVYESGLFADDASPLKFILVEHDDDFHWRIEAVHRS
ncbi:hypothetical protein KPC83_03345 [Collinsella sp. zg1085]|uniref:hypothetical protein n=1 Tax=Collinsella sp. zg1085 TaxID=2844380 RepID=UPI001C0C57C4|nr:hypothetical protein [Collinsella sp. zg1085]QWT18178.1 hypothetical protein KPC83_03345 [Collinsella sp. zg1085]